MSNLLLLGVGGVATGSLLDRLVAYWKLDEASGTRNDSHGANHLTDNNTVTQATGKLTSAAQFTAANSEYLSIADNAALSMGDFDFSLTGWFYLDSVGVGRALVAKGDLNADATAEFTVDHGSDGKLMLAVGNGSTSQRKEHSQVPSLATWYWFYCYHDAAANEIGVSIDNAAAETAAYSSGSHDTGQAMELGRWPVFASGDYDGRLDGVGIWKRLLTSAERTALYNGGSGLDYPFN